MSGFLELRSIISVSTAAMKMLAKDTAFLCPLRYRVFEEKFHSVKMESVSFKISLSISLRWSVGIRGLFRWNVSYVLHTIVIPSSCGMLVYRLATSIWTQALCLFRPLFSL